MSKYDPLWKYLKENGNDHLVMTFDEIKDVLGFEIDHSFLNYKKEAKDYGYQVGKISLWNLHGTYLCMLGTNGCSRDFLKKALVLNPDMTFIDDVEPIY